MAEGLTFDPIQHKYTLDGRPIPNVTQIIGDLKLSPPYPEDRGALAFGKAVHKACELYVLGKLDVDATSPVLMPYVRGFIVKAQELNIRPILVELKVFHRWDQYAGTLDLWCSIGNGEEAIIDFKTGVPPPCVELQLAAYEMALDVNLLCGDTQSARIDRPKREGGRRRRFSMQLTPDRAILRECKDEQDYAAFTGAAALWRWKYNRKKGV